MADSYIQVAPDSTGKQMQTYLNTISAQPVHAEAVVLVDSAGAPITSLPVTGPITNAQLRASEVVVSGTVTATGPITNAQLRASEVSISAASLPLPALASTSTKQTDGSQKTQIVDGSGSVIGSTANALNVYLASITANSGTNLNTGNIRVSVFQGAATLASGQVANVANVSTTIAGARATRRSVTIRNQDLTNSGYVGPAPIGIANGILLRALESISVDFVGVIAGISATTSNVTFGYLETYD